MQSSLNNKSRNILIWIFFYLSESFIKYSSDKSKESYKYASMDASRYHKRHILLHCYETCSFEVFVLSEVSIDDISCKTFDRIVEFVSIEVISKSCHSKVWPMSELDSMFVSIIFNVSKSVFECLSVQQWVKCVSGSRKDAWRALGNSRVSFLCQVI